MASFGALPSGGQRLDFARMRGWCARCTTARGLFVTAAPDSGKAVCWMTMRRDGARLYAVNAGDGSISMFDTTLPTAPVEKQRVVLSNLGPSFTDPTGATQLSSAPFREALDPAGKLLYVVTQRQSLDPKFTGGNTLRILDVATDGTLKERSADVTLAVPIAARPQGIVVF